MPDPVTWGHVLMALGLVAGLYGLWQLAVAVANRGHGRGTPLYARARTARRHGLASIVVAVLLFAAGCFTRLSETAIG